MRLTTNTGTIVFASLVAKVTIRTAMDTTVKAEVEVQLTLDIMDWKVTYFQRMKGVVFKDGNNN